MAIVIAGLAFEYLIENGGRENRANQSETLLH